VPTSPIEAEATGQEFVTAIYGGHNWTIRLDVETWPVDLISATVIPRGDTHVALDYAKLSAALRVLLGDQWDDFRGIARKRRDLVPASQAFAAAVGFPFADRTDVAFGAVPRLLRELERWPGPVEATLRAAGFDYRDRWLFMADRRRLTLRQIHVALDNAAWDSPIAVARNGGRRPFSDEAIAVMDLYEAITKVAYYRRPLSAAAKAEREATAGKAHADAVADYKRRHTPSSSGSERRRSAAETARANVQFAKDRKAAAHAR
jgi:hypothetical protein